MLLKRGDRGDEVRIWQTFLYEHPVLPAAPDGIFGPRTTRATEALQMAEGLTVDGIAGPATFREAGFDPQGVRVLSATQPGNKSDAVARWQAHLAERGLLRDVIDGVFGQDTERATKAFQHFEGLTPDGVVGAKTRARAVALGWGALDKQRPATAVAVGPQAEGADLRLGMLDPGVQLPAGRFQREHEGAMRQDRFRGLASDEWIAACPASGGAPVRALQEQLVRLGLLPADRVDGIFGYRTQAAVRLLQTFTRGRTDLPDVGRPEGVVGPKTRAVLQALEGAGPEAVWPAQDATRQELTLRLLRAARDAFAADAAWQRMSAAGSASDTLPVAEWSVDPADVHLVGIRRPAPRGDRSWNHGNTDLYLLLARERLWVLFGNTEPNPKSTTRPDPARLVRGQHRYRFGWHNVGNTKVKDCYPALRPWSGGVLAGATADYQRLPQATRISSVINVHWSGRGQSNWGQGCQVIASRAYVSPAGQVVSCKGYDAGTYSELADRDGGIHTRGAFHLLPDLYLTGGAELSAHGEGRPLRYTLLDEDDVRVLAPEVQELIEQVLPALRAELD